MFHIDHRPGFVAMLRRAKSFKLHAGKAFSWRFDSVTIGAPGVR